jgi:uncharacterized protein YacL
VRVSLNFLSRIVGMLLLTYLGLELGLALSAPVTTEQELFATQLLMLAGAGLGLIVTPRLTIDPVQRLLRALRGIDLGEILFVMLGCFIGLLFGVLLTIPLVFLPAPLRQFLPLVAVLVCTYVGAMTFVMHRRSLQQWQQFLRRLASSRAPQQDAAGNIGRRHLLDTSAIIDGRIAEVAKTGFLDGSLVVPRFVLIELQGLADSGDDLRRNKGRRGLELLNQMQQQPALPIEIVDMDVAEGTRVDDALVLMARQNGYPIITNDFNLNRVANLQGVQVLSLNQLSEAVRPPVMQDQHLHVVIRNEGNSRQQGVGYLEDGTPVIVEDARNLIGQNVEVVVVRLHQTQTGRLVFANLYQDGSNQRAS